jgi:hypothetical protein
MLRVVTRAPGSIERGILDVGVINAGDYFFPWLVAAFAPPSRMGLAHGRQPIKKPGHLGPPR